jgi:hypothetical protein
MSVAMLVRRGNELERAAEATGQGLRRTVARAARLDLSLRNFKHNRGKRARFSEGEARGLVSVSTTCTTKKSHPTCHTLGGKRIIRNEEK